MANIESPLGKTTSKAPASRSKEVFTVEDKSVDFDNPQNRSFDHNPVYKAQSMQRQGDAEGYNPREKISPKELEEYDRIRSEAKERKKRISPEAKLRLEFLFNFGRIVDSVSVNDDADEITFQFQSLTGDEQNEVFSSLERFKDVSALRMQYEIRFQTLARALTHIQGKPLGAVIESDDIEDKVDFIRGLDENVSDFLYKWFHENIEKKGREKFAIKSKEDLEEVLEDIKK